MSHMLAYYIHKQSVVARRMRTLIVPTISPAGMCMYKYLYPLVEFLHGLAPLRPPLDATAFLLAEGHVSLGSKLLEPPLAVGALDVVRVGLGRSWWRDTLPCSHMGIY